MQERYINTYAFALLAASWLLMTGCLQQCRGEKMVTRDQALEIASKEFIKYGYLVSDYDISIEPYHADENQWIVWFDKKGPFRIPGGKHAVLVHKTTGQSDFLPGE